MTELTNQMIVFQINLNNKITFEIDLVLVVRLFYLIIVTNINNMILCTIHKLNLSGIRFD